VGFVSCLVIPFLWLIHITMMHERNPIASTIQKEFSPAHLGAASGRQPVLGHSIEVGHQAAGFVQRGKQPLIMPDIVIG